MSRMPAARGTKRTASKSSTSTASTGPKNKKKRGPILLEIPSAPKKRGRVLTCGQGDVGQLGLGEDVVETTVFKFVSALGDKIVDVHAGGMHTIALDSSGKVWTFGCNDEGALGRATGGESEEGSPAVVPLPQSAVAIVAGDSHSAALLHNGDVYAWGAFRDSHGSMGLVMRGREGKSCREPVKLELPEPGVDLASGGDHLVVLTTSGSVYTMGCGEQGQLGRLAQRSATRDARQGFSALLNPSKVTLKLGASRVWAGYHATFVLDANKDKVFAWGLNNYGQLGITGEKRRTALFSPTQCDAFAARSPGEWRAVSPGQHHSLALDSTGQVYAVGRCEYGRLGLGDRAGDAEALEPVPKLSNKKCISISAGTSNSFAVTDSGEVFAWGMGSEGQLGTGQSSDANEPTAAVLAADSDCLPQAVSAGGQHTVLFAVNTKSQKEPSPTPEKETETEKVEDSEDALEKVEEKEKKPRGKRQKKEQDIEISSTSSAQATEIKEDTKPEKVNGDEKKETPMEVDETDNTEEKKDDAKEATIEDKQNETETQMESGHDDDAKPETTDSSSQDTTDSETKSQGQDHEATPAEDRAAENTETVNGTEEMEVVESKTVEASIQPAANPLTTTA